jgi:hypothetical protein
VAGRGPRVRQPAPVRCGLRVSVGGRGPSGCAAGRGEGVPARHDRRAGRRQQGNRRPGRGLPGVDRVVGRPAARLQAARHAPLDPRGRRRSAGVLGRALREVFPDTREQR